MPPDTYLTGGFVNISGAQLALRRGWERGNMKEVWVLKEPVLRARDEQGLERRLHSFESALRRWDGAIVDVERSATRRRDPHVAVIRYEIPLPDFLSTERRQA